MVVGFLDKMKDSQEAISLVDELRNAIVGYQVGDKHMALPRFNARGTALATNVDAQPDSKNGCKVVGPHLIPGLTKYQGFHRHAPGTTSGLTPCIYRNTFLTHK